MANRTESTDIIVPPEIDKEEVKKRIYEIRGHRVMIDSDIAPYFGVTTGNLNKAMKRNIKRFPPNFCFQLTSDECSRFQIGILNGGRGSNLKYLPFAYTEQGIAMLTSALHTDTAILASIKIMEAFVEMTHYLQQSKQLIPYQELQILSNRQDLMESDMKTIKDTMVRKSDLTDLIKLLSSSIANEEILLLNGEPFKADIAYQQIYKSANKTIIIIDDYIGIKTLQHLVYSKNGILLTIISDNRGAHPLRKSEYDDYLTEYPGKEIRFLKTNNTIHDRFIVVDYGTKDARAYLCGSSSKDSGKKVTMIMEMKEPENIKEIVERFLHNPELKLK